MGRAREAVRVVCAGALLVAAAATHAGDATAEASRSAGFAPLAPAIVEYRWDLVVPEWVVETRIVSVRIYAPVWHARRIDYALPEFRSERRRIGSVAETSCKYADFRLPNECRTTWRDVHADVPVLVLRRDSIDADVPEWSWRERRIAVDEPRLVWKKATLIVSVPAYAVPAPAARPAH